MGKILDFIKNGGIIGSMRGFDHRKEGHIYGFQELYEDLGPILQYLGPFEFLLGTGNRPSSHYE